MYQLLKETNYKILLWNVLFTWLQGFNKIVTILPFIGVQNRGLQMVAEKDQVNEISATGNQAYYSILYYQSPYITVATGILRLVFYLIVPFKKKYSMCDAGCTKPETTDV